MRSALVRVWDRICDTAYDRPFLAAGIVLALGGLLAWRLLFVDGPPQLPDETWKLAGPFPDEAAGIVVAASLPGDAPPAARVAPAARLRGGSPRAPPGSHR